MRKKSFEIASIKNFTRGVFNFFGLHVSFQSPQFSTAKQLERVLSFSNVNILFDIGSNEGQFSEEIRNAGYCGKIVSFEPLTKARESLIAHAQCDKKWIVHRQCAIGDTYGDVSINISGNSVSSSLLEMLDLHEAAAPGSSYVDTEVVPISTLDQEGIQYLSSESILFIKIDTQGYEWEVLNGASNILRRATGVLCEVSLFPLYDGQKLWDEMIRRFHEEGFILWALQKGFVDPRTGQSLQMDAIFLRPSPITDHPELENFGL